MKSILKATAVLSSASVVSILAGLVSAKVSAVLIGPGGMGLMGLLQSMLGLGAMFAGLGASVGLVRAGARALATGEDSEVAALRRGAWLLCWGAGGAAAIIVIIMRTPLSRLMLGSEHQDRAVLLVAAALVLTLAAGVQNSILNTYHRVSELARVQMWTSLLGLAVSVSIIWRWRAQGIAWVVLATGVVAWAVSYYYARRTPAPKVRSTLPEAWGAARALLRFGVPYTASMLVGTGLQLALPVLVLHTLTTNDVGYYRAATAVSVTYLGFMVAAMAQDYYPRVSAVGDEPQVLGKLVNEQCRLVLLIAGPIILGMLAVVPYLVPLVYSSQFTPAVTLLEWQLIGDIFKFAAWTMSFVILARSGSKAFFGLELIGGCSLLLFSVLGIHWFGLEGMGVGFLCCTITYGVVCWALLRREIGLRWTRENQLIFITLVLMAAVIRVLPYVGLERARTPIALALAALASAGSLYVIWGQVGGIKGLLARERQPETTVSSTEVADVVHLPLD
jgi:PST family polysaccharide transporter